MNDNFFKKKTRDHAIDYYKILLIKIFFFFFNSNKKNSKLVSCRYTHTHRHKIRTRLLDRENARSNRNPYKYDVQCGVFHALHNRIGKNVNVECSNYRKKKQYGPSYSSIFVYFKFATTTI